MTTSDPAAQSVTVTATGGALRAQVSELALIDRLVQERLRDGRSVRASFRLTVLDKPAGTAIGEVQERITLSFDLWEERFVATRTGPPGRSFSHKTPSHIEAWCLDQLSIPVTALGARAAGSPFWIRLVYEIDDLDVAPASEEGFSIATLIDRLSRRRRATEPSRTIDAGPFRVSG